MMRTMNILASMILAVGWLAHAGGCNEPREHVYSAQLYATDRGCLEAYAPIDLVLEPGGEAHCAPVCLTQGPSTYVSVMCPPYPAAFDTSGTGATCGAALDAFARGRLCASLDAGAEPDAEAGVVDAAALVDVVDASNDGEASTGDASSLPRDGASDGQGRD